MKVKYSPLKIYLLLFIPICIPMYPLFLSVMGDVNVMLLIFLLMSQFMFITCSFIFAQLFIFEIKDYGFYRKWMGITEQKLKWDQIKRLEKIPLLKNDYFIKTTFIGSTSFPILGTCLIKNKAEFLQYVQNNQPELINS